MKQTANRVTNKELTITITIPKGTELFLNSKGNMYCTLPKVDLPGGTKVEVHHYFGGMLNITNEDQALEAGFISNAKVAKEKELVAAKTGSKTLTKEQMAQAKELSAMGFSAEDIHKLLS